MTNVPLAFSPMPYSWSPSVLVVLDVGDGVARAGVLDGLADDARLVRVLLGRGLDLRAPAGVVSFVVLLVLLLPPALAMTAKAMRAVTPQPMIFMVSLCWDCSRVLRRVASGHPRAHP